MSQPTWDADAVVDSERPTQVRHVVVSVTTLMAVLLYLDRVCVANAAESIRNDLGLTQSDMALFLGAFFWSYALGQVPFGWLSDRLGARGMLTFYILAWSFFTGALGMVDSLTLLILMRLGCGLGQAGAYPTSAALLSHWVPLTSRGLASSIVALGGRIGGFAAPLLTGFLLQRLSHVADQTWRPVMYLYGLAGLFVAALFWFSFRNRPDAHPWTNDAECELIAAGRPSGAARPSSERFPFVPLITNASMNLLCIAQIMTNIGWAFLIMWLPRYLDEVHHVPTMGQGVMTSIPMLAGIVGMLLGGRWTDQLTLLAGVKWGRRLPLVVTRFTAALGYALCFGLTFLMTGGTEPAWLPWAYVAALSLVAFSTDMGNAAIWAFSQDVGGRYVGAILGWGNMWGNLGAAVAPIIYDAVLGETPSLADWNRMFLVCLSAFVIAGLSALALDATQPIESQPQETWPQEGTEDAKGDE